MAEKIDLVIPWVDGCDHEWQKQKSKYDSGHLEEEDFFVNGLPTDSALVAVHQFKKEIVDHIIANDLGVINENFNKFKSISKNITKWFSLKYGKALIKNLYFLPTGNFIGFELKHIPQAYLKSTLKEVWERI